MQFVYVGWHWHDHGSAKTKIREGSTSDEDPRGVNVQELLNKHAKTSYNGLCNVVNMGQPHRKRYLDTVCLLRTCELLDPMSGGACI